MINIKETRRERASLKFFEKAPLVHNNKYDYSKVVYLDTVTKIIIICPVHGEFLQQPGKHVNSNAGCKQCVFAALTKSEVVYDRELAIASKDSIIRLDEYITTNTAILHKHECGHVWKVSPSSLISGKGCPVCANYGFNGLKPGTLYYIKVENLGVTAYKIGITNTTLKDRFRGDMRYITVLKTWTYELGADAYQAEQNILKLNKEFKYGGINLLKSGNTELFNKDIGGFDE